MPDAGEPAAVSARQESIVTAATGVFLRFGLRKTTMDDVAREAGISRQGLYLHFKSKDAVFRRVVEHMLSGMRNSVKHALEREDLPVAGRLVEACEAFHGLTVGKVELSHFGELLEAATSFAGPRMREMERDFVADIARLLDRTGHAAPWAEAGISATDLAEHLFAASAGAKYESVTLETYRTRVHVAARIVMRGTD
ncbi:TetR/AcrR family transcriptional regulator [Streptomyces sp. NPDC050804]|uniref:TetR/AcrR family transcriptional regulator n=1 Tax=Streptomyces sp. NPDC050804 TaxID=3154745 RepID=UPI00343E9CC6